MSPLRVLLGLGLGLGLAACAGSPPAKPPPTPAAAEPAKPPDPVTVAVVATTDIHGHLQARTWKLPDGRMVKRGGLPILGGFVNNLRQELEGRVVLLDGGDVYQGTLISNSSDGRVMIEAMNYLGYAAAAVGNHEFDWGRQLFLDRAREAKFAFLAANITDKRRQEPPAWTNVSPYTVVSVGDLRIGVIGLSTLQTPTYQPAGMFDDIEFTALAAAVEQRADWLRRLGAGAVVVTAHEGGACRDWSKPDDLSSCDADSHIFELARALKPGTVNLIVGGHTHRFVAHTVNGTPIIQGGAKAVAFARADLVFDRNTGQLLADRTRIHPPRALCLEAFTASQRCDADGQNGPLQPVKYAGRPVVEDAGLLALIKPYDDKVKAARARTLGVDAERPLTRSYDAESSLGNLIADALRESVEGAHVGMQNSGGIRADIDSGPITYGDLFDVLPFGNKLATVRLSGTRLRAMLRQGLVSDHGIVQLSGLRVEVDRALCADQSDPITSLTLADGTPVTPDGSYLVVTNGYLTAGGSGFDRVLAGLPADAITVNDGLTVRDAVATWLGKRVAPVNTAAAPAYRPDAPRITIKNPEAKPKCP